MKKVSIISAVDGLPVRESGGWITRKYHYLRRYLKIFSVGMKGKWGGNLTYIDLFAGPGRCLIRDSQIEIEGSGLISLEHDFRKFIFMEKDPDFLDSLKKRCQGSPKLSQIEFIEGDCNLTIDRIQPDGLAVAFIDPTGIDFHFEPLKKLCASRKVDLLMTVMLGMDIKRNLERYRRKGAGSDLDKFLGGSVPWNTIKTGRDVMDIYKERLKALGYQTVEFKDIEVKNDKNVPMYFLMFASKDPKGLAFWKKISAVDETGQRELF